MCKYIYKNPKMFIRGTPLPLYRLSPHQLQTRSLVAWENCDHWYGIELCEEIYK